MRLLLCILVFSFSQISQAQPDTLNKYNGRGVVTAINWGSDLNIGAGYTFINGKGIDLNMSYLLWYRIIRRHRKRMCDHQWFVTVVWSPGNNSTLKFRLGDLWWRNKHWSDYLGIRVGPVGEISLSSSQYIFSLGSETLFNTDRFMYSLRILLPTRGKASQLQLGISVAYRFELSRNYSCSR
jgi:hypothetical protein